MIFAALLSCTAVIHESNLFHPKRKKMDWGVKGRENVTIIAGDSTLLRGWLFTLPQSAQSIIYFYGNDETVFDNKERLSWLQTQFKAEVLAVDYRGYGFSEGTPSIDALLADGLRVYDFLASRRNSANRLIFVYGYSLGTLAAIQVAAHRPVAGVILEGPFSSAEDVIPTWGGLFPWPLRWFVRVRPDEKLRNRRPQPIDIIRNVSAPLLVIHGTKDQIVPIDFGEKMLAAAASSQKHWCPVQGADHGLQPPFDSMADSCLKDFIRIYGRVE